MDDLFNKKCEPCEGGVVPFDISEIHKYQKKIDGWSLIKNDKEIFFLEKEFKFDNFLLSQKFVNPGNNIVAASDAFFPFTDGIEKLVQSGLSENDFILASKIDKLISA